MSGLLILAATSAMADTFFYHASQNTLPEAQGQGWIYTNERPANPAPFVSGGLLFENTTDGAQYWMRSDGSIDFTGHFDIELNLRVVSSNLVPRLSDGTPREGYYFGATDRHSRTYDIGLSSAGFNINSASAPNQPLTLFPIADGNFHTFRLDVNAGLGSFSIDGNVVVGNIVSVPSEFGPVDSVLFGAVAGRSVSQTELKSVDVNAVPEPGSGVLLLTACFMLVVSRVVWRRRRPCI